MRLPRPRIQLNDEQHMVLAILLVIMVAVSILYCLVFASLILRENWDKSPLPLNGATPSTKLYREGSSDLLAVDYLWAGSSKFKLTRTIIGTIIDGTFQFRILEKGE